MAIKSDKEHQAAQVLAARHAAAQIRSNLVVLQEAEFFVDVDTLRDLIDPPGAAACVYRLSGRQVPDELKADPNVLGLLDELDFISQKPQARLALKTLFANAESRKMLKNAIQKLQHEFGDIAGTTPILLEDYFDGKVAFDS